MIQKNGSRAETEKTSFSFKTVFWLVQSLRTKAAWIGFTSDLMVWIPQKCAKPDGVEPDPEKEERLSFLVSSFSELSHQPVEDRGVGLAENGGRVEVLHLPSMHHQHPVTVHDGVDPGTEAFVFKCPENRCAAAGRGGSKLHLWAMVSTVLSWNLSLMVRCSSVSVL